jgi:putative protease
LNNEVELLAPVGSWEALVAAVQNGADAVYLGGKLFNARHYASNFSDEELKEAVSYAHLRGVLVFVTVNILIDDSEMEDALDYAKYLYDIGVDAIIVQDVGYASLVRKVIPNLEIHGSTQMTINNLEGAKLLQEMGFARAVLAREVPAKEIKNISDNCSLELEVFVHGALCYSYSGQCLMSSLIGGRSGNRGTCAQPCRMQYSIVDDRGTLLNNWDKSHFLSTRDLNTIDQIGELISLGIKSFKIEGRMKRAEYVAALTSVYRRAIDEGSNAITEKDKENIKQIFNRGFTKGLTFGDFGKDFVTLDRPDNRGIRVGTVLESGNKGTAILLKNKISKGDGLEWLSRDGSTNGLKSPRDIAANERFFLQRVFDAEVGSDVNRTSSVELLQNMKETYSIDTRKTPIIMNIMITKGEPPILKLYSKDHQVDVKGDVLVQPAANAPLTMTKVEEQLVKLGDTPFYAESIYIELEEGSFLPVKELNELRRSAVLQMQEKILYSRGNPELSEGIYLRAKKQALNLVRKKNTSTGLSVRVSSQLQLDQMDLNKLDRLYLGFYENIENNLKLLKTQEVETYLWTDRILYQKDLERLGEIVRDNYDLIDGISVSNLGSIMYFKRFGKRLHGDFGLNAFNSLALDYLEGYGLYSQTMSVELNIGQIETILRKVGGVKEAVVYGYLPSMVARNCPMAVVKGCKDDSECKNCRFAHGYRLRDRMGKEFAMERGEGFTTIYNSVPLMVPESLISIRDKGIALFRLEFTIEEDIKGIQSLYYDYLNGKINRSEVDDFMKSYKLGNEITNGHYFRGVLER